VLIGLAALAVACDSVKAIHYENKTTEPLFVRVNNGSLDKLSPGYSDDIGYLATRIGSGSLQVLVVDVRGCTALDISTTVAQFQKEHDFSLVINQSEIPPSASRAPCDPNLAALAARTQE
jgi:hypothetical protein